MYVRRILRRDNRSILQEEWDGTVARMSSSSQGGHCAICQGQRFVWAKWIFAGRKRLQLVELSFDGEVCSPAADVRKVDYHIAR